MGSSLLSEKESGRRQKEGEGDIEQTAAIVSALWCLDGSCRKSRQPLKSCQGFQERGVIAGSVCATGRVDSSNMTNVCGVFHFI